MGSMGWDTGAQRCASCGHHKTEHRMGGGRRWCRKEVDTSNSDLVRKFCPCSNFEAQSDEPRRREAVLATRERHAR